MPRPDHIPAAGRYWWPAVLWALMIFFLSGVETFPQAVEPLLRWDKAAHLTLYAVLGFLLARALSCGARSRPVWKVRVITVLLTVAYGVCDEWRQSFVPGRVASAMDVLFDGCGGLVGQWLWFRFGQRLEESRDDFLPAGKKG